jgi:hypothetical protein
MKRFMTIIATAIFATTATASANDFKATEFVATAYSGALEFSLGTVDGELNTITTGATIAEYQLGQFDTLVYTSLEYGRLSNTLDLSLEYKAQTEIAPALILYGSTTVSYVAPTTDLSAGDVFVAPKLGVAYAATDSVGLFGDVEYSWNASNSWTRSGGVLEVGLDYNVSDSIVITPSVLRTFDTAADTTNFKLELGLRF